MNWRSVIATTLLLAMTTTPSFCLICETCDPPPPRRITVAEGWIEGNGETFTAKHTTWGLKITTSFTKALPLQPGDSANFSMSFIYAGQVATATGSYDSNGNCTLSSVSSSFPTLTAQFNGDHPEAYQAFQAVGTPETFWDCMRVISWALLASAGVALGCGVPPFNLIYCTGAVAAYVDALHNVSKSCQFGGI